MNSHLTAAQLQGRKPGDIFSYSTVINKHTHKTHMPHETQNMYRILRRHYHQHICRMHFISSPRPGCKLRNLSKNLHGQPTSRKPFFIGLRCPDSALRLSLAPGDFADCILKACSCAADNMLAFILLTYSLAVEKLRAMLGGADYYDDVNSFRYI